MGKNTDENQRKGEKVDHYRNNTPEKDMQTDQLGRKLQNRTGISL